MPFVGYSWSQFDGPGQTTYFVGQDEFRLGNDLNEKDQEIRAGFAFNFSKFYGQVTQGWRDYTSDETLTLVAGAGSGNNLTPILGRPIEASSISRDSRTDVSAPFTNLYVVGQPFSQVRVIGNYSRFVAETDGGEDESLTGSFASFELGRFFNGLTEEIAPSAKNTTWRGGARAEINISDGFDFFTGFERQHRELEGSALISTLLVDSITFGGVDPRNVQMLFNTSNQLERDEDIVSAGFSARAIGPFAFRATYFDTKQDVVLSPDAAEILVPPGQGGTMDRSIQTLDLSGTMTINRFTLGASWRKDDADQPILRTDFLDRERVRLRAAWRTPGNMFRAALTAEQLDQTNDRDGIGYDGEVEQFSGDVELTPIAPLSLRASYSEYKADSIVNFIRPETFVIDNSIYAEKGESVGGGFSLMFAPVRFDADITQYDNTGTVPFTLDRYRVRLAYDFAARVGVAGEWATDKYSEAGFPIADYDADRIGVFLRFRP
jgi:hypothetical protein